MFFFVKPAYIGIHNPSHTSPIIIKSRLYNIMCQVLQTSSMLLCYCCDIVLMIVEVRGPKAELSAMSEFRSIIHTYAILLGCPPYPVPERKATKSNTIVKVKKPPICC